MRRLAGAALVLAVVAACAGGGAAGSARAVLDEFSVDVDADRWTAGPVAVSVENAGEFGHTLVVTAADGQVVAATDLIPPGGSADLTVDLDPGAYQLTCRIVIETDGGAIVDHYEEGMLDAVRVIG